MKRAVIKIPFIVAVLTSDNRVGFYTGSGFDTVQGKAKPYGNKGIATIQGSKFVGQQGVKAIGVYPATASLKKQITPELKRGKNLVSKQTKNPIKRSRKDPEYVLSETGDLYIDAKSIVDSALLVAKGNKTKAKSIVNNSMNDGKFKELVLSLITKTKVIKKKIKNPIAGSKKRRIKKAQVLYEDFTGHKADQYEIVNLPQHDTGLKVGQCIGIMYETTRDGKKENYLHEFKKASQPALCVSHDGQQIYLIGGSYLFKDSGINDV